VRADGSARRRFWEIKAVWLAARAGERPAPNALVVTRADNGTVRLPRRLAGAAAFRLLLDGRLLAVTHAEPTLATRLDYVVEDQLGETDMFIVCDDPATPLTGWPADYLRQLLRSTSHRLRRAAAMCRAVVETLAGASPAAAGVPRTALPDDSLAASASGLAEAHMAVQRAARSVYRLETLRNAVLARSVPAASEPAAPEWLLSAEQMALLKPVEAACAQAALLLSQASERPKVAELTLAAYQTSRRQADAARESARALLQPALAGLRADLASGALPPTLALLQAWLVDVLTVADLGPASQ
jgi:hypothetical protein